jgi:hypothetical protein
MEKHMNKIKNLRKVFFAALFSVFLLAGNIMTNGQNFTVENSTDRPGGDYQNFDLSESKFESCQAACANDPNCQAYTYVHPNVQGSKARCWLKNTVPPAGSSSCCISGVKKKSASGKGDFAGEWYAGEWGNINFSQNGEQVSGSYTRGNGTIYGTVSGNRLNATWQQEGKTGTTYFIILADGTIEGRYCDGKNCNPENGTYFSGRRR